MSIAQNKVRLISDPVEDVLEPLHKIIFITQVISKSISNIL